MGKSDFRDFILENIDSKETSLTYESRRMIRPKEALIQKKKPRTFEMEKRLTLFKEDGKRVYDKSLNSLHDLRNDKTLSRPLNVTQRDRVKIKSQQGFGLLNSRGNLTKSKFK
jgi:hypothetical protein